MCTLELLLHLLAPIRLMCHRLQDATLKQMVTTMYSAVGRKWSVHLQVRAHPIPCQPTLSGKRLSLILGQKITTKTLNLLIMPRMLQCMRKFPTLCKRAKMVPFHLIAWLYRLSLRQDVRGKTAKRARRFSTLRRAWIFPSLTNMVCLLSLVKLKSRSSKYLVNSCMATRATGPSRPWTVLRLLST